MTGRFSTVGLLVALLVTGCRGVGSPAAVTPPSNGPGPAVPAAGAAPALPDELTELPWEWSGDAEQTRFYEGPVTLSGPDGASFVYTHTEDPDRDTLQRLGPGGKVLWTAQLDPEFVGNVALLLISDTLYVARYCTISSGARLLAFGADNGKQRWSTWLQAMGPVAHSEYFNEVQLREQHGHVVVYGNESQGRYVEVVDPATGRTLSNRRFPN